MKFVFVTILMTLMSSFNLIQCDKEPLECQTVVDRSRGLTFCQFSQITAADKNTSKINIVTSMFQGRVVESNQVTAVSIAFSEFDHIPSSVFTSFGDITRVKFYGGKLKHINKDNFKTATHLRFFEVYDTEIDEISSKAFSGASELEEITFENCSIGKVAADAFVGLKKMKKLRLTKSKYSNTDFLNNLPKSVETIELP